MQAVLTRDPPAELSEHYTKEHVKSTRAYSLDKKNLALCKGVFDFAESCLTLTLVLLPVAWRFSENLVDAIRPGSGSNEYIVSIAFTLITMLFETVKDTPWGLYSTFVVEERHGFNKQTLSLFFTDMVKQVGRQTPLLMPRAISGLHAALRALRPHAATLMSADQPHLCPGASHPHSHGLVTATTT